MFRHWTLNIRDHKKAAPSMALVNIGRSLLQEHSVKRESRIGGILENEYLHF